MSNSWLGFTLTPHDLRIDDDDADDHEQLQLRREEHHHLSLLPLHTHHASLCLLDPLSRPTDHHAEEWRYENAMTASNTDQGPKLEDFLGCCYSDSHDNLRANPSSSSLIQHYSYEEDNNYGPPSQTLLPTNPDSPNVSSMYHVVPFDHGAMSVSGYKWLRQTPFSGEKSPAEKSSGLRICR
ncbi:uncharacterized protein LOC131163549 [Malania oleifera]|uniref:uncharacterized protein LOC131163549 n=1 Tax=Malania oleifera TaxID=397392 RepID=UPI0025AE071F|nr:uncharacterized protein LOC131163549 [Malania oleifera]